ncbi:acetyl-CoA C-acyltransferase [Flagellatimonas centrodinii]|uniref:acetyl-CoA C-acyltransferase n=1 Tax=Flagellatimonas centrodinii TaxID=2806210 RepID=UPI001FEDE4EE|nr:acetyl-CoA C-acyltransferase [Flagellatimonas centrodinii]ULQ45439.1 acetyl-CoA C-acyltransferase [Flagellatimonas centrodinii]
MSTADDVVITGLARTPMGALQGAFSTLSASDLGAVAIKAAVARAGIAPEQVEDVIMGNVLGAGQGQAPARQASRKAGLPDHVTALTINKMCGSGLKAVMLGADMIRAGSVSTLVAGGMESMTNAPHLIRMRAGLKYGHGEVLDHMAVDGLEDAYQTRTPMGVFAETAVDRYGYTRAQQDAFAIESLARARRANEDGSFDFEMTPVDVHGRKGTDTVRRDEGPFKAMPDKIPSLKPAFRKDGTITAANASSINDGAAALVLMSAAAADRAGATPLARIVAHSSHARLPGEFTVAPVDAIRKLLAKIGWAVADVDLWEINEAFAVVTMAAMQEHGLSHDRVNVNGGACALGHPIGASGARILTTLIGALRARGGGRGVATLCIGGGEAVAVAIEVPTA